MEQIIFSFFRNNNYNTYYYRKSHSEFFHNIHMWLQKVFFQKSLIIELKMDPKESHHQ